MDFVSWERIGKENHPFGRQQASKTKDIRVKFNDSVVLVPKVSPLSADFGYDKLPIAAESTTKKNHKRTASLTDLRPEDKRKVANLIQEIANLGSQKLKVEERLVKERTDFETAIKQLVDDQKSLLKERHAVQAELTSCQAMIQQLQDVVLNRSQSDHSGTPRNHVQSLHGKPSELEDYIHRTHSEVMDSETKSDITSVCSEALDNPRVSSTILEKTDLIHHQSVTNSTLNYSRKDQLRIEREQLVVEQRLLRQRLMEQEELLRQTQHRLDEQESQQRKFELADNSTNSRRIPFTSSRKDGINVYSVGTQVEPPSIEEIHLSNSPVPSRPVTGYPDSQSYVANRLIPSPANYRSSSSIDHTMQRTSQLLSSARKIIDDANNYQPTNQLNRSANTQSQASYSLATPRKSHRDLFSPNTSLASVLNNKSIQEDISEADKTEIEILEDIFYVR